MSLKLHNDVIKPDHKALLINKGGINSVSHPTMIMDIMLLEDRFAILTAQKEKNGGIQSMENILKMITFIV